MQYHRNNRRKYLLLYPVIFVVKYRKKILSTEITETVKASLSDIALNSQFQISEVEADKDHLHLMIDSSPNVSISQIVRRIKQQTTLAVWQNYEDFLRRHFWREKTFWSDGYFASSVGNASIDTVRQYIQNQG
jgi:putative transposase